MIALERHRQLTFAPPLAAEQEAALNQARLAGDAQARELMILSNLRLVWHLAKRYAWSGIPADDLFSSGVQGLIGAVDTYDHDRGRLAPHARMHIRKDMLMLIATQRSLLHLPSSVNYHALLITRAEAALSARLGREPVDEEIALECGLSVNRLRIVRRALGTIVSLDDSGEDGDEGANLHESLADEDATAADQTAAASSRWEWLAHALERLSPREQKLLRRHFGLDGRGGLPLARVAEELCISRERLRQIEIAALRKLRHLLQADDAHLGESFGHGGWDQLLRDAGLRLQAA
ncbi:MAG: sigma-70 family RNA polymerase sigma factor [Opitutaceae bacterium]|nr:sigma-70 family RNA polymerase sigma factor [Opitutaceae bacterium]